jgi:TrmH family RNA methyltransferase
MKGTTTEDGFCIAEGFHTVEEAIRSNAQIRCILVAESARIAEGRFAENEIITVPDALFDSISSTESPQGVMAMVRTPLLSGDDVFFRGSALVIIIDGIQDPGNAGAVIRSAEAFGATGVIFLHGSVSPYNPKAIRASAGSIFRMPVKHGQILEAVTESLEQRRVKLYAATPRAELAVTEADLSHSCAFVIGAEGRGVSKEIGDAAIPIRIPTQSVESLNAAVAAAILAYETWRQRSVHHEPV